MSSSAYGRKLNPYRRLRDPLGAKGVRQSVVLNINHSDINQKHVFRVSFNDLGRDDAIVPGTARLAFTISLTSTDANRTVVQNLGRSLVNKIVVKMSGKDLITVNDSDVYYNYVDLWKTTTERANMHYQGIDTTADRNATKLRVGAGNGVATAADSAIKTAYGNRFYIPLDFEILESHMPYYQSGLKDRLEYELTFNDYSRVVQAVGDPNARYKIENISLEFEKVQNHPELTRLINNQYAGKLAILYEKIHQQTEHLLDKRDSLWNICVNVPARSLKGVLMLFKEDRMEQSFQEDTEAFYNPKITHVKVTVDGQNNQLYDQGMLAYQQWDEARKFLAAGSKRHPRVAEVAKDLGLADVSQADFLTSKFCLWLDMRLTDDDRLHGSGRAITGKSDGVKIQINKTEEAAGRLNVYVYALMDAQINIENGRYIEAIY